MNQHRPEIEMEGASRESDECWHQYDARGRTFLQINQRSSPMIRYAAKLSVSGTVLIPIPN